MSCGTTDEQAEDWEHEDEPADDDQDQGQSEDEVYDDDPGAGLGRASHDSRVAGVREAGWCGVL